MIINYDHLVPAYNLIKIFLKIKLLVNYCETEYKLAHCQTCWLDGGFGVDALCSACEDGYTLTPGGDC